MRNEAAFWTRVRTNFNERPRAVLKKLPAEGFAGKGVPDGLYCVEGIAGVLELKYVPRWPAREATPVTAALTPDQRNWLEDWVRAEGRAHVLLGVASDWFLLELHEVPDPPRLSRFALEAVRRQGRAGTMKGLNDLPGMLAELPAPALD